MSKDIIDTEDRLLTARARQAFKSAILALSLRPKDHHVTILHADLTDLTDRLEWLEGILEETTSTTTVWEYSATDNGRVKFNPVGRPGQCLLSRQGTARIVNQSIIPKQTRQGA